jgi:hypothetical protein
MCAECYRFIGGLTRALRSRRYPEASVVAMHRIRLVTPNINTTDHVPRVRHSSSFSIPDCDVDFIIQMAKKKYSASCFVTSIRKLIQF